MKTGKIKYLALMMLCFILCALLSACGSKETGETLSATAKVETKQTVSATTSDPSATVQTKTEAEEKTEASTTFDLHGETVTVKANWYVPDKLNRTTTGKARMKQIAAIEEKFNCKIQLTNINWGTHDQMMLAGQPECDILGINPGRGAFYYTNNMLYPLDDLGVDWNGEQYDHTFDNSFIINGTRYVVKQKDQAFDAIRFQSVLFFNRKLLENAGVDPDSIYTLWENGEWTWVQFESIMAKVAAQKDANGKPKIYGCINTNNDAQLWVYLIQSNGSDVTKNEDGIIQFNIKDPKAVKALDFWQELCRNDLIFPSLDDSTAPSFVQGNVAFIANYLDRLDNQQGLGYGAMKDDFGIVPIPKGPDAEDYNAPVAFYEAYAIPTAAVKGDREKARALAAIIDELCKPLYTPAKEASSFRLQIESLVRDAGSLKVLQCMNDYRSSTDFYEVFESSLHHFYSNLMQEHYANGTLDTATLIGSYYDEFNQKMLDRWVKE